MVVADEYHTVSLTKRISAELNYIKSFFIIHGNSQKYHNQNGFKVVCFYLSIVF